MKWNWKSQIRVYNICKAEEPNAESEPRGKERGNQ